MSIATGSPTKVYTLADLLARLGDVPAHRILTQPPPGMAGESDVLEMQTRHQRLCELVDGVLVEKAMGYEASVLAMYIGAILTAFVQPKRLGLVSGADGMMRLFPGLVRIPDVAFASWSRFPKRKIPREPIPSLVPDLAVEVLSQSNTAAEMTRKVGEYFAAGVLLVWIVDPLQRIVTVFTAPDEFTILTDNQELDGGNVLPGFQLKLAELFAELDDTSDIPIDDVS
jgi:Uma2 family endonuclease